MPMESSQVESPREACLSILHYLVGERDPWRRDLLLADFANMASALPPDEAAPLNELAVSSCLPRGVEPGHIYDRAHSSRRSGPKEVDVVITTVTPLEWRAAQDVFELDENEFEEHDGRRYHELKLHSVIAKRDVSVALTSLMRPTNVVATKRMFDIRNYFEAQIYFLLGIAAGRKGRLELGDVVVPERVHYYAPGRRLPSETRPRPGLKEVEEDLQLNFSYYDPAQTQYFDRLAEAFEGLAARDVPPRFISTRKPEVVLNNSTLVSGEQLIQDGLLKKLAKGDERVMAGDQEGYGFAEALSGSHWAIFRGISDYGEKDKPNSWQYVAVYAAALALRDFLETQFSPKPPPDSQEDVLAF
jgi:nucleoside phosphorylase